MEDKSMTAAPLKTSEAIAAESRQMLEKSGMNLAKLAEPLIKASCRTGKNGEACFDSWAYST